jgi:hypothetical protein
VDEAIDELYMLIRLSGLKHGKTLQKLDENVGRISKVASITQLNDGSWEMLILKFDFPILQRKLSDMYQSFTLDLEYDPFESTQDDAEYWGLDCARNLYIIWFMKRAKKIIRKS